MLIMKLLSLKQLPVLLLSSLLFIFSQQAFSAAGDSILNMAEVEYQVGGVTQTVIESSETGNNVPGSGEGSDTLVIEDQLINFAVVTADTDEVPAVPGDNATNPPASLLQYTVYNIGAGNAAAASSTVAAGVFSNGTITVSLTTNNSSQTDSPFDGDSGSDTADEFNAGACTIYSDAGGTTAITDITIAPDSSADVWVACVIPGSTDVGQDDIATIFLQGEVTGDYQGTDISSNTNADANTMQGVEYVFADPTGSEGDSDNDKIDSDYSAYVIETAVLNVSKTATVVSDPINISTNPKAIPGAVLEYTISIENTGTVAAANVNITDTLPADLACVSTDPNTSTATPPVVNVSGGATASATAPSCSGTAVSGGCASIPANGVCDLVFYVEIQDD